MGHALRPRFCWRQSCGTVAGIAIRTSTEDCRMGNSVLVEFLISSAMFHRLEQAPTVLADRADKKGPGISRCRVLKEKNSSLSPSGRKSIDQNLIIRTNPGYYLIPTCGDPDP
jgi:hypothetical protein